jgi:tRNA wybutosine-synthesizing protein 3
MQSKDLPDPSASFTEKKNSILEQLAVPDAEYTDLSPKGTVDKGIRHLIDEINSTQGFVTTSSCAGRVSVFLEGRKAPLRPEEDVEERAPQVAGVGGKGAGGTWLYVSHDAVDDRHWVNSLEFSDGEGDQDGQRRLIHFKFEPMVSKNKTTLVILLLTTNTSRFCMSLPLRLLMHNLSCAPRYRRASGNRGQ